MPRPSTQLQRLRSERGWSVADVGDRTGIAVERIVAIENGTEDPWFSEVIALADAYEMDLDSFAAQVWGWRPPRGESG